MNAGEQVMQTGAGEQQDAKERRLEQELDDERCAVDLSMLDADADYEALMLDKDIVEFAAESGDVEAQYDLGASGCFEYQIPEAEARAWHRKAAAQGHKDAQYELGLQLAMGSGMAADEKEAVRLLAGAASQGHRHALRFLVDNLVPEGVLYVLNETEVLEG